MKGRDTMKRLLAVLMIVAILVSCTSPALAKKGKRRTKSKNQPQKQEQSASRKWYEGGNLHDKTMSDWKEATQANKLATCGDIVTFAYKEGKLNFSLSPKDIDNVKKYAQELGFTMDLVLYSDPDNKGFLACPVSNVAVVCMAYLGWLK